MLRKVMINLYIIRVMSQHVQGGHRTKYKSCTDLSDPESVGQDPVHGVGLHLRPLQLEAVDSRLVLPQSAVRVVVKLGSVGLP